MAIKNYTTKVPAVQTVSEIQGMLATHGARRVMMDMDDEGKVTAVTFAVECFGQMQAFRLEAKVAGVLRVMERDRIRCDEEQAERIAWRNVKDWIAAQLAMVETEQASVAELFFANVIDQNERRLFDVFQSGQLQLEAGGTV